MGFSSSESQKIMQFYLFFVPKMFKIKFLEIILKHKIMCYLKNLSAEEQFDFDDILFKRQEPVTHSDQSECNVLIPCEGKKINSEWSDHEQKLVFLFNLIQKNNSIIRKLNQMMPNLGHENWENSNQSQLQHENAIFESQNSYHKQQLTLIHEGVKEKIFGNRSYSYSLKLASQTCVRIYKGRNFQIHIELHDQEGNLVRNSNMVNLFLAICTKEGEWILENTEGQKFIKGKTEVELSKGHAEFEKIYPRDVSKNYPDGKVFLVVYAKPSSLIYSSNEPYGAHVQADQIEPLIIEDVIIKSKKGD